MNKFFCGNIVKATQFGTEFNLTEDREYKILDYCCNMVLVRNDSEDEEWYTVEYFY